MQAVDIQNLGVKERKAYLASFQPALAQRGMRNLVLSTLVVLTALALFSIYGVERIPLGIVALLILFVLLLEKASYFLEVRSYRSLVRELALRIEQQPVTMTHPSEELAPQSSSNRPDHASQPRSA